MKKQDGNIFEAEKKASAKPSKHYNKCNIGGHKLWCYLALASILFAFSCKLFAFSCKQPKGDVEQKPTPTPTPSNEITITVKGDTACTISKLNEIKIKKSLNLTWKEIRILASSIITLPKNKEIKEWRITDAKGEMLKEETIFEEDATIFAVSKGVDATYTVEHWQENIEDDEFTRVEDATETLTGESGKNTEATTTKLVDGEGEYAGKKLLIGKVGATVKIENPTKENFGFYEWVPALPKNFMKENDKKEYVADWREAVRINIIEVDGKLERDERLEIKKTQIVLPYDGTKTWKDIKEKITENVSLKSDWNDGDYEIYDWRLKEYEGDKIKDKGALTDESPVTDGMNVYPRSNYAKFEWGSIWDSEENHIKGYNGEKPRGKIIIPTKTIMIGTLAFSGCTELTAVDFTDCSALTKIGDNAFTSCEALKEVNLTGCSELTSIDLSSTGIKNIDLSPCPKLTNIYFDNCKNLESVNLTGCSELTYIDLSGVAIKNIDLSPFPKLTDIYLYDCKNLESINLTGCSELISIGLSHSVIKNIDLSPFPKLTDIYLYGFKNLESINLTGCSELTSISLSGAVIKNIDLSPYPKLTTIYFSGCKNLESVNLTGCSALTHIQSYAFYGCEALKEVNLTGCSGLTEIKYNVFRGFEALEKLNLTGCSELTEIDLEGTGIKNIDLSPCSKLTDINFAYCKKLESVNLTSCSALTTIERGAFSGCVEAVVKLPASITKISEHAFGYNGTDYCKEVHVPNETIKGLVKNSGYPENRIKVIP